MTFYRPVDNMRAMTQRAGRDPDALLARADVRGDSRRDQHFLIDDRVLDRLPGYAAGFDTAHVLEIGGGTGALTDRLLALGGRVAAIERDRDLAAFLREEFAADIAAGRLHVIEGDAADVELPDYTVSVSNLPYGASSEILFRLLPRRRPFVVMVQREFGERMVADPGTGDYGRLSVTAQHYADLEIVEHVPPTAFTPQPQVESVVVRSTPREPDYAVPDEAAFLSLVTAVFTQRRKTMRNAIRNTAHISGLNDPDALVAAADPDLMDRRPGSVRPREFAVLVRLGANVGGDVQ